MSNWTEILLSDQEPKVWEYVYLLRSGDDVTLYYDGYVIGRNAKEATEKVIQLIRSWEVDFNPEGKVISVKPFGRVVDV